MRLLSDAEKIQMKSKILFLDKEDIDEVMLVVAYFITRGPPQCISFMFQGWTMDRHRQVDLRFWVGSSVLWIMWEMCCCLLLAENLEVLALWGNDIWLCWTGVLYWGGMTENY